MAKPLHLAIAVLSLRVLGGCFDASQHPGDVRVIDTACAAPGGCALTGDARRMSGLTADSTMIRLGKGGSVTIKIPPLTIKQGDNSWHYEILANGSGDGKFTADTIELDAPSKPTWITLPSSYVAPVDDADAAPPPSGHIPGSTITFTAGSASRLDILDVRVVSEYTTAC